MVIKPTSGVGGSPPPSTVSNTQAPSQTQASKVTQPAVPAPPSINPEAVAKALKDYQKIRDKLKQPFMKGAANLFTDNIVFPPELLDPKDPANDPKYLHLLFAIFGLKELERHFASAEQQVESEEEEEPKEEKKELKSSKKENPRKKK